MQKSFPLTPKTFTQILHPLQSFFTIFPYLLVRFFMNQKKLLKDKKMKKTLFAVLAILTLLTRCSKSENTNTVSTDGSTSMEKVIGILGEVLQKITRA